MAEAATFLSRFPTGNRQQPGGTALPTEPGRESFGTPNRRAEPSYDEEPHGNGHEACGLQGGSEEVSNAKCALDNDGGDPPHGLLTNPALIGP